MYINKYLIKKIKQQIKLKKWVNLSQKKLLIRYFKNCKINLFMLHLKTPSNLFYVFFELIHNFIIQIYAIEYTIKISRSKMDLLLEFRYSNKRKNLVFKQNVTFQKYKNKYVMYITCLLNQTKQKLFVWFVQIMFKTKIDWLYNMLNQDLIKRTILYKIYKNLRERQKHAGFSKKKLIWKSSVKKKFKGFLNYIYFKYINNMNDEHKYFSIKNKRINEKIIYIVLNSIKFLIYNTMFNHKIFLFKNCFKKLSNKKMKLLLKHKLYDKYFNGWNQTWKFYEFKNCFTGIFKYKCFLNLIKIKIKKFLFQIGLKIDAERNKIINFKINTSFSFLSHIFVYLTQTKLSSKSTYFSHFKLCVFLNKKTNEKIKKRFKNILGKNQNKSIYKTILTLNQILKKWFKNFFFFNLLGTYNFIWIWFYKNMFLWIKKKHFRCSLLLLNKRYLRIKNSIQHYFLSKNWKTFKYMANLKSIFQKQQREWNFYDINKQSFLERIRIKITLKF